MPLDLWQDHLADLGQHGLIRPRPFAHEMQQRLMLRAGPRRRGRRGHRLDALSRARQQQPRAIIAHRPDPRSMPDHVRQRIEVTGQTPRAGPRLRSVHAALLAKESAKSLIELNRYRGIARP